MGVTYPQVPRRGRPPASPQIPRPGQAPPPPDWMRHVRPDEVPIIEGTPHAPPKR